MDAIMPDLAMSVTGFTVGFLYMRMVHPFVKRVRRRQDA